MFLLSDALSGEDSGVDPKSCQIKPRPPIPGPAIRFKPCNGMPAIGFGFYSFEGGTLIETALGRKRIEDIEIGDVVAARDEFTGGINWRPVRELFRRTAPSISRLTLDSPDGKRETLSVTSEHPFFVEGKGWLEVRRLQKGDRVISEKSGLLAVADITHDERPTLVYNFEVAQDHNYFVGYTDVEAHNPSPWEKYRKEVFDRTNGECFYCGDPATQLDHWIPRCMKPADPHNPKNSLVPACARCNQWKWAKFPWTNGRLGDRKWIQSKMVSFIQNLSLL